MSQIVGEINMDHGQKGGDLPPWATGVIIGSIVLFLLGTRIKNELKKAKLNPDELRCLIQKKLEIDTIIYLSNNFLENEKFLKSIHGIIVTFTVEKLIKGELNFDGTQGDEKIIEKLKEELIINIINSLIKEKTGENNEEKTGKNNGEKKCISKYIWGEKNDIETTIALSGFLSRVEDGIVTNLDVKHFIEKFKILEMMKLLKGSLKENLEEINADLILVKIIDDSFTEKDKDAALEKYTNASHVDYRSIPAIIFDPNSKYPFYKTRYINPIYWSLQWIRRRIKNLQKNKKDETAKLLNNLKLTPGYLAIDAIITDRRDQINNILNNQKIPKILKYDAIMNMCNDTKKRKKIKTGKCCVEVKEFEKAVKEREEEKAARQKGYMRGGALIGQGTFGCVFKPHLLCDGKQDTKDRKHVSKLIVMRREDDYRLNNELEIGQLILKSNKYNKYFSPIISTCPINFKDIDDKDKYNCNSANKYMDNKMILAKLKKVNGTNMIDTIDNIRGAEAVYIFFDIYKDALEGIKFLTQKKIIHYDIKWDNLLYDTKVKRGILIDFGLSFQIKYLKFDSLKKLKKYFYVFVPKMDLWCIEIHYICYLLNINSNPDLYDITDMVNECISNNSLFKSEINRYFDLDKNTFYDNSISVLMNYQKDYPDILKRIKYIVNKFYKTWDNYSLSIMFLKQYDLILKEIPNKFPTFHKKIITDILWKNIQPNPKKRLTVKKTIKSFNKLYDNLNSTEFLELSKYA